MVPFIMLCLTLQDADPARHVESLRSDDLQVRLRAAEELAKTPLERLPRLEPFLDDLDPEVRGSVRRALAAALYGSLGRRTEGFALKAVAPRQVMKDWFSSPDRSKVPAGYEAIHWPADAPRSGDYAHLNENRVLVESTPVVTGADIEQTEVEEVLNLAEGPTGVWRTDLRLRQEGARKLDDAACRLFNQDPRGLLAIIVNGAVHQAPVVGADRLGGWVPLGDRFSRVEAERIAKNVQGEGFQLSFRVLRPAGATRGFDEVSKTMYRCFGETEALVDRGSDRESTVNGPYDAARHDLVGLWQALRKLGCEVLPSR